MKRGSGILLPVFSLPSRDGIGTLGRSAYEWVDFLKQSGQQYWQVLPMGPTSYGDSPYQSFSAFAGNPYFIDPQLLLQENLITESECEKYSCHTPDVIDYELLYERRFLLLKKAFGRFKNNVELQSFRNYHSYWLEDYALYSAIKADNSQLAWTKWPAPLMRRDKKALDSVRQKLKKEIDFYIFMQYKFFCQWNSLKEYANLNGIAIIGDMPIYVAMDSADTWSRRELFQLDDNGIPQYVAGCPPDAFSDDGQLWGNPLYNWAALKAEDYNWWLKRLNASFEIFDTVRIDHFRGLESYFAIPYQDKNARGGHWEKGPDLDFIQAIKQSFKGKQIIAEDLGFLTPAVHRLLRRSHYPGMRVLQFAFDASGKSTYLPHNYDKNCVVYTGTHDNDTTAGWIKTAPRADVKFAKKYLGLSYSKLDSWSFIRCAMASTANLAVVPMQDYLGLGSEARINLPSTIGGNWVWQMQPGYADEILAKKIADITKLYGR